MGKLKSSIPTTKALQAWQSELRRLERRLEEWSAALAKREKTLEQQEAAFDAAIENADGETVQLYADRFSHDDDMLDSCGDSHCGCTPEDAASNCDCPKCVRARADWAAEGDEIPRKFPLSDGFGFPLETPAKQQLPVGDEVKWLENLWKLEDSRKKKK
jgi:hypothetical protein